MATSTKQTGSVLPSILTLAREIEYIMADLEAHSDERRSDIDSIAITSALSGLDMARAHLRWMESPERKYDSYKTASEYADRLYPRDANGNIITEQ